MQTPTSPSPLGLQVRRSFFHLNVLAGLQSMSLNINNIMLISVVDGKQTTDVQPVLYSTC